MGGYLQNKKRAHAGERERERRGGRVENASVKIALDKVLFTPTIPIHISRLNECAQTTYRPYSYVKYITSRPTYHLNHSSST